MRRWRLQLIVLFLASTLALLLISCGSSGPDTPASETAALSTTGTVTPDSPPQQGPIQSLGTTAPWADGERFVYNADQKGQSVGTMEITFAKETFGWTITDVDALPPVSQTVEMRVDSTLRPLGENKTATGPQTNFTYISEYKDSKLTIKAQVDGQDRQASIDVPPNSLDNDQLLMTLRALDFRPGLETKLTTIVANNANKIPTTVRVQSKETIAVPAGNFETWKTELDFGKGKQYCWYQVEAPHQMVQYDNGSLRMALAEKPK